MTRTQRKPRTAKLPRSTTKAAPKVEKTAKREAELRAAVDEAKAAWKARPPAARDDVAAQRENMKLSEAFAAAKRALRSYLDA